MRMASIREFRSELPAMTSKGDMVLVTNHGRMVGCFMPMEETGGLPVEFKKEFLASMGRKIAGELAAKGVPEKDILDDFKRFKKARRGQ